MGKGSPCGAGDAPSAWVLEKWRMHQRGLGTPAPLGPHLGERSLRVCREVGPEPRRLESALPARVSSE